MTSPPGACRLGAVCAVVGLLVTAATAAAQVAQIVHREETRDLFPGAESLDAAGHRTVLVARILDVDTHRPIHGATCSLLPEDEAPVPGPWTPLRQARSDRRGWVRLDVADIAAEVDRSWFCIDARGYAPRGEFGHRGDVALEPGRDVAFRVVDPAGRPYSALEVGLVVGCGHTPDVRVARTDAAGKAMFRDVARQSRTPSSGRGGRKRWLGTVLGPTSSHLALFSICPSW